jgi:large subunit ribosomal protein L35
LLPGSGHRGGKKKRLQANKHTGNPVTPAAANIARSSHAQDEDQEQRQEALPCASGGTVKRGQAFKRHILTKKTTKNKRHLRGAVNVHESNMGHMAQMLPLAGL